MRLDTASQVLSIDVILNFRLTKFPLKMAETSLKHFNGRDSPTKKDFLMPLPQPWNMTE